MYLNGYYVEQNETEAFRIYEHCMELLDDSSAEYAAGPVFLRLGNAFLHGCGTERNPKAEQAMEFAFLQQLADEESQENIDSDDDLDDGISISIEIGGSDDDEDWRDELYGNEMELDPDDYDSEEEFRDAYAEKERWVEGMSDKIRALADDYGVVPVEYDDYEEFLDALKIEMD